MKRRKAFYSVLIFFIITSVFFGSLLIIGTYQTEDQKYNDRKVNQNQLSEKNNLKSSNGEPLKYASIKQNTSNVRRVFESIEFIVNITDFKPDGANKTIIQITFKNGDILNDNMTEIPATNNWTYTYTPKYNDSLGLTVVKFRIYNATGTISNWELLNAFTTKINFTIRANCGVNPSLSPEYKRNQILSTNLVIEDSDNLNWVISIVDSNVLSQENTIFIFGKDIFSIQIEINESFAQENKLYYLKVNLTEKSSNLWAAPYFQFKVLLPVSILASIIFNPTSIFREQSCNLDTKVSYIQNDLRIELINISFNLIDSGIYIPKLTNKYDGTFKTTFSIDATYPARIYHYIIKTLYNFEEIEEYTGTISVKNNLPEIDGYEINDYDTDESISVNYGEDLVFTFDVFDIEGVAYITLLLINENNDKYEISREYEKDLEITVRTEDLITGTWVIYVYVTDTDGATVGLSDNFNSAPQEITVIPDTLSDVLPWIMLIIGLIIGILVATGITYYTMKSKMLIYKPEEKIEALEKRSKKEKKPKKPEPTPTKPKPTKKLIEEEKPEKKELRKPRKIKRKLK